MTGPAELLRSVGLRATAPRVAVLAAVQAAGDDHVSADEVLARVEGVHRATVYRTLDGLAEAGVLRHVHLDRGRTAYHLAGDHLHAQCHRCGRVVDLPGDVLDEAAARIRRARGFRVDVAHVALSGLCQECAH